MMSSTSGGHLHTPLRELLRQVGDLIEPDDAGLKDWFLNYRREHVDRLVGDLQMIEQDFGHGVRVLEYGAVPLLLTAALDRLGYDVSAVDLAPERFDGAIARLGLDVKKCDVETEPVPFGDQEFDLVLFSELFEHLRIDPIMTMTEAHRVLKPRGTLLLSTPNLRSFRGLRNLLVHNLGHVSSGDVYRQFDKIRTLGHMGHVREYTTREVSEFLSHVGFRPERIVFRGGHGAGVVGLAERLMPSLKPSFSLVATRATKVLPAKPHEEAAG